MNDFISANERVGSVEGEKQEELTIAIADILAVAMIGLLFVMVFVNYRIA